MRGSGNTRYRPALAQGKTDGGGPQFRHLRDLPSAAGLSGYRLAPACAVRLGRAHDIPVGPGARAGAESGAQSVRLERHLAEACRGCDVGVAGATGATGFGTNVVKDRFHPGKHSDFFQEKFVAEYWLPFILYGHCPNADYERLPSPVWHRFISTLPIRWFVAGLGLTASVLIAGWTIVGVLAWLRLPWSFLWRSSS